MISSSKPSQRFNLNCSSGKDCVSNFMTFLMIISCDFGIMCMSHKHQPPVFSTVLVPLRVYIKLQMSCTYMNRLKLKEAELTLFLPGEGGISPLIVYHVTTSVKNRVKLL